MNPRFLLGFILILPAIAAEGAAPRFKSARAGSIEYLPHRAYQLRRLDPSRVHVLVQLERSAGERSRRRLAQSGVRFLRPIPGGGWVVSAPAGADLAAMGCRRAAMFAPEEKFSRWLSWRGASEYFLVEFHPDVDRGEAESVVTREGATLVANPDLRHDHLLVRASREQAERLAEWDEVAYIFPASWELRQGIPVVACTGALTDAGPVGQYILTVGDGWDGPGRGRADLTYTFERLTERLPPEDVVREIWRAIGEWARYIDLRLAPGPNPRAPRNLNFLFTRADHGDGYPFDGPGRNLAHTFYPAPPNPEPIAGDVHLDDDESWRAGAHVDLFSVVLHELGHALGLGHADDPTAVMYPYYRQVTGLAELDIASIRLLYAPARQEEAPAPDLPGPGNPVPPPETPVPKPETPVPAPEPPPSPKPDVPAEDRVAPSLAITSPASTTAVTSESQIVLRGTARDNVGVVRITWTSSSSGSGAAEGTSHWRTPPIPLLVGTNTITIRAYDAAGNVAWRSVVITRR